MRDFVGGPVAKTLHYPMHGAQVRELNPACCNEDLAQPNKQKFLKRRIDVELLKIVDRRFTTSSFWFLCVYLMHKTYEFPFHLWVLYSWHNAKESLSMGPPLSFEDMTACFNKRHISGISLVV